MSFHDQVGQVALAQLLAHCQPGLTTADDQRLDLLNRHVATLFCMEQNLARRTVTHKPSDRFCMTL
jgi:hypothetical protein